jgi:hypothetical protein
MQDIHLLICEKLNLNPEKPLKKKIRGLNGFNIGELVFALVYSDSLEDAAYTLGYTSNPIKQCIREILIPLFPDRSKKYGVGGGHTPWYFTLLSCVSYKKCPQCSRILPYSKFHSNTHNSDNLSTECGNCRIFYEKLRKATILQRLPSWADREKIREIYRDCPEGMHVDHIIPIKGKLVSGLHVHTNLQYLTAEDNLKKSNYFNIE